MRRRGQRWQILRAAAEMKRTGRMVGQIAHRGRPIDLARRSGRARLQMLQTGRRRCSTHTIAPAATAGQLLLPMVRCGRCRQNAGRRFARRQRGRCRCALPVAVLVDRLHRAALAARLARQCLVQRLQDQVAARGVAGDGGTAHRRTQPVGWRLMLLLLLLVGGGRRTGTGGTSATLR